MNCKQAERDLALWAGDDLDDARSRELTRHLAGCSICRARGAEIRRRLDVLHSVREAPWPVSRSLWPGLVSQLDARDQLMVVNRFNGWVPALAVVAACLTIVVFGRPTSSPSPSLAVWAVERVEPAGGRLPPAVIPLEPNGSSSSARPPLPVEPNVSPQRRHAETELLVNPHHRGF